MSNRKGKTLSVVQAREGAKPPRAEHLPIHGLRLAVQRGETSYLDEYLQKSRA